MRLLLVARMAGLAVPFMASAQTITVVNLETGTPVEGVAVTSTEGPGPLLSDIHGRVNIAAFASVDSVTFDHVAFARTTVSRKDLVNGAVVRLEMLAYPLQEFVLSSNRWEQAHARIPDRITVIEPRDVAFNAPATSADMLQQTGEVFLQKSQLGGGSPMLRGFAANRILIVVDGVRMNNAIYRAGNLQNVLGVDASAIERAEVIHGPGAMTYGSDAIGGVMDFHLLRARFAGDSAVLFHGGAGMRYASAAEERGGHVHLGVAGRKLAFVASASFNRFNDLRMGADGPEDYLRPWYVETINGVDSQVVNPDPEQQVGSGYDNVAYFGKLAYKPLEALEIGVNLYYSTTSDVPRYDRLIELRDGAPRSAEWYYGPQNWLMGSLRVRHTAVNGPWSTARLILSCQEYEESRNDRNYRSSSLRTQSERVTGPWVNLDLEKELSPTTQLFYGAELVLNKVGSKGQRFDRDSGEREIINARYPDGSTWSTGSVYAGAMHDIREHLTLSTGLRLNWSALDCAFDTTLFPYPATSTSLNCSAVTGALGLAFRPATAWKFSMDLSTGLRAPNIDDIGKVFDSEPGAVIVPNPDLGPEYAYNIEAGIEKIIADRVRLGGSGYYILLDDAMVRRPFPLNGQDSMLYDGEMSEVLAIQNAAQAIVTGFVLAVDVRLPNGFTLDARYSWQDGVEQDDDNTGDVPLRHAPPPFGQAGLGWERRKLRLRFYADFSGGFTYDELPPSEQAKTPIYAMDANGDPYAPDWYTVNIKGSYQVTKALQVTAGVENITDQRYRPYSSGITAPGVNVIAALRASF